MKIQIDDFVFYQSKVSEDPKRGLPTVHLRMIKVTEVSGDHFKDEDNKLYDNFRGKYIFRKGIKEKIENEDYDEIRVVNA